MLSRFLAIDIHRIATWGLGLALAVSAPGAQAARAIDSLTVAKTIQDTCSTLNHLSDRDVQSFLDHRETPTIEFHQILLKPVMLFSMSEVLSEFNLTSPSKLTLWIAQNPDLPKSLSVCRDDLRQTLVIRLIATADQRGKILAVSSFFGIGGAAAKGLGMASRLAPRTTATVVTGLAGYQMYQAYQTTRQALEDRSSRHAECEKQGLAPGPCLTAALNKLSESLGQDQGDLDGLMIALEEKVTSLKEKLKSTADPQQRSKYEQQIHVLENAIERLKMSETNPH